MRVDDELLSRLEKLSMLKIDESERTECIEQLDKIVSFVQNLSSLDTDGVDEVFAMNQSATALRLDEPRSSSDIADDILKNAPLSEDSFFIVPKIIE